jgi:hypothetical protein
MPPAEMVMNDDLLLRVLLFGAEKRKKSWWALNAAKFGFNVIMFDGDNSSHILRQIVPEARKRINVINLTDPEDGARSVFAPFLGQILKGQVVWDEQDKIERLLPARVNLAHSHYHFDLRKLSRNDVFLLDSWSAAAASMAIQSAIELGLQPDAVKREQAQDWDVFNYGSRYSAWLLNRLKALPCHVVVIGHQDTYERRTKDQKTVMWQRLQIKGTSGNQALNMGQHFSDIFYFKLVGDKIYIDTGVEQERMGGSRLIAPKKYAWEDLQFDVVCREAGVRLPGADGPLTQALKWYPVGEMPETLAAKIAPTAAIKPTEKQTATVSTAGVANKGGGIFGAIAAKKG